MVFLLDSSLKTSLESIRQVIHNRFKPSSRHNLQLMGVKQKDTESVEDFIHRVTSLTNDRAVDQDWLITVIINGLKEDLSMEVIKADPQTLEDVRNIASRAEMAGRRRTTTPALQESTNLALLNALQEIRDDVREFRNPQQPRRDVRSIGKSTNRGLDFTTGDTSRLHPGSSPWTTSTSQTSETCSTTPEIVILGVSFVILYITMYHRLGVFFFVENWVILRKIAHTDKLLTIHNTKGHSNRGARLSLEAILKIVSFLIYFI